jgi:hypothetical protein
MQPRFTFSFAIALWNLSMVEAHLPLAFEPERVRQHFDAENFDPDEDYTFEQLFDIIKAAYDGLFAPTMFNPYMPDERLQRLPTTACFVLSRLHDDQDVDYFVFDTNSTNLDFSTQDTYDLVGYAIVPFCTIYEDFYPSIALIGPLDAIDGEGNRVFEAPDGTEPFQVPDNHGVLIKYGTHGNRTTYHQHMTNEAWFLPDGYPVECIENYKTCLDRENAITVLGIPKYSGKYYFVVFDDSGTDHGPSRRLIRGGRRNKDTTKTKRSKGPTQKEISLSSSFKDYSFVVGTQDNFMASDWVRLAAAAPFISDDRSLGHACVRPT